MDRFGWASPDSDCALVLHVPLAGLGGHSPWSSFFRYYYWIFFAVQNDVYDSVFNHQDTYIAVCASVPFAGEKLVQSGKVKVLIGVVRFKGTFAAPRLLPTVSTKLTHLSLPPETRRDSLN